MRGKAFSLIFLPTLQCNADCDYCFEDKTRDRLSLDRLPIIIDKVLDYLNDKGIGSLTIHWQGGEAMLLPPHWYAQAYDVIHNAAQARQTHVEHGLQTNMIGYSHKWDTVIAKMFDNSVSSSMDFPNVHRKVVGGGPDEYTDIWVRNVQAAREAGIDVKVISVPNQATLDLGAERLYTYFVDELQVTDFQINTPFPGGEPNPVKHSLPLDVTQLSEFYLDLADIWLERGAQDGVKIGPFDELLNAFSHRSACLPCIWAENCTTEIVSIDARGNVAQCDCWVTSYPEYSFGNIFACDSFAQLLQTSPARQRFLDRPAVVVQKDCIECDYLSLCHGGCPVRTYTIRGSLFEKDPYCHLYKALFGHMQAAATQLARQAALPASTQRSPSCSSPAAALRTGHQA